MWTQGVGSQCSFLSFEIVPPSLGEITLVTTYPTHSYMLLQLTPLLYVTATYPTPICYCNIENGWWHLVFEAYVKLVA